MRTNKIQSLIGEDRDYPTSLFDKELRERAPTAVFNALKAACFRRSAALKSSGPLSPEEMVWLRGVLQEGEAALAAVRSLIQNADQKTRLTEALRLRQKFRRRQIKILR